MNSEGSQLDDQLSSNNDDCNWDQWAALKDAASTVIFIVGAYAAERLPRTLFPDGMPFEAQIVIRLSSLTFLLLTLRIFINELRCLLKNLARLRFEGDRYVDTMARRDKKLSKSSDLRTKQGKKSTRSK